MTKSPSRRTSQVKSGTIRAGIGGWTFEPWRGVFYPPKLPHAHELGFASRHVTAIEINGTYYGSQKPESFRKWAAETPDDFVFSVKGPRFATNRKVLAEAGESVARFLASGIAELGDKLGPLLWQFAPTKKFDPVDFTAFLALLPNSLDGRRLRHVVEVRHESFVVPEFVALLRQHDVAVVLADHATYPLIADVTANFAYVRLQAGHDDNAACYKPKTIATWADRLVTLSAGGAADDLPLLAPPAKALPRDVFAFFINEGKVRAPAGAAALIAKLPAGAPRPQGMT